MTLQPVLHRRLGERGAHYVFLPKLVMFLLLSTEYLFAEQMILGIPFLEIISVWGRRQLL